MKNEKFLSAVTAIGITALVAIGLSLVSVEIFYSYGMSVFLITPFVCGLIAVLIYNRKGQKKLGESVSVSILAGGLTLFGFLLFALEGIICLLMAAPLVLPCFLAGGLAGYAVSRKIHSRRVTDICSLVLVCCMPLFMGFESGSGPEAPLRSVETGVLITGSVEEVWKDVTAFSPIPEPREWAFRMGIAYPTHATIEGEGPGAVRYCVFSTGKFVEPITVWEEPRRLAFDVAEQPVPMIEISPYSGLHPPHLDWALQSERGEFRLHERGDGRVELVGTTWYGIRMRPVSYWGWISDYLIQKIHLRVLNHIKTTVESFES